MEHSLLHAVALSGLILVAGGPLLILGLLGPAARSTGAARETWLAGAIHKSAARWVSIGAVFTAVGALLELVVEVAETRGGTIYGGVPVDALLRFVTRTQIGKLGLAQAGVLMAIAVVARNRRWPRGKWWTIGVLSLAAIILTAFVSHAAAQATNRTTAIIVEVAHIGGAAVWLGVVVHLLAARNSIEHAAAGENLSLLAQMVRRFSPIALGAVSLILLSGVFAAFRFLGSVGACFASAYGLTLLIKLTLLLPALFAGWVNFRIIGPALQNVSASNAHREAKTILWRFGRMLELEATAGVLVLAVAGILGSISPPGENSALRLTAPQIHALISPRLPSALVPNPSGFYGAPERTTDDLRYSEFMHHASGIMVCLLGACWLAQALRGRMSSSSARTWPWLMVPFALFVGVASDPELWWLRRIPLADALANGQIVEHQLGAVMILTLVWLGLRDGRHPEWMRPLGYGLPAVVVVGSLLLLGHAHSTLAADDSLTNLINVQHAVFGAFGLFAGVVRWLSLRGLFPTFVARWLWPVLVVGLGLFMVFCYREVV